MSSPAPSSAMQNGLRRTPDNRKPVLQLDSKTRATIRRFDSQRDAALSLSGDPSRLSEAIRSGSQYLGFLWTPEGAASLPSASDQADTGPAGAGGGAGARVPRCEKRARLSVEASATGGRRLVAPVDFGHSGTGYAMAYKGADGLCAYGVPGRQQLCPCPRVAPFNADQSVCVMQAPATCRA